VTGARVRKNSVPNVTIGPASVGSRRNTISHIDLSSLALMDNSPGTLQRMNALGIHPGHPMGFGGSMPFEYRGMSNAMGHHGHMHGLPKLDLTNVNNMDPTHALRTAPAFGSFAQQTGFDLDQLFNPGSTVNPAQLHSGGFGGAMSAGSQYPNFEAFASQHPMIPESDDFSWMRSWSMQAHSGQDGNENAIEESSPSRISSGDSPADYSESMANSSAAIAAPNNHMQWPQAELQRHQPMSAGGPFQLEALGSGLPNLEAPAGTVSPSNLQHDSTATTNAYFEPIVLQAQIPQQQHPIPDAMQGQIPGQSTNFFAPSMSNFSSDSPSMSSSMTGSARQSSVTSIATDSITDATRQALLNSLAQPTPWSHGYRKQSQPSISSPLSPGAARNSMQGANLPCTADIRRYVDSFIQFALPHMPVAHVPTLVFDSIELSGGMNGSVPPVSLSPNSITGGGGCLILAMASIGALYEYDHPASKELFDAARKMIGLYLDERRRADAQAAAAHAVNAAHAGQAGSDSVVQHTPLWLVQAMLLNVIYGHQCGDKVAADIASNHCAALVSLARAAGLSDPPEEQVPFSEGGAGEQRANGDVDMADTGDNRKNNQPGQPQTAEELQNQWMIWKDGEERKRTLFAIFIISSLLTTAYNQQPTIMNSEIKWDLPCDEELWCAETAQEWQNRGGLAAAQANSVSFADALGTLLTANERGHTKYASSAYNSNNPLGALQAGDASADSDLRPSTFGCLVLINALHNYIWETRSRHNGKEWTSHETEAMFSLIEPALNAWQAAWKANDHHKLERPNPFGFGPLAADSIPLLDLAFVRLFVNLGRSKEAFWHRDFDGMAEELARGSEIVQHAEGSPHGAGETANGDMKGANGSPAHRRPSRARPSEQASTRRERHLRKAAFYAADSLTIASSYNLTYADMSAHELPIQSAMCFFDCTQVLAEWACTVQERVGSFLGVLGRNPIDYSQVPAIMLLESEDVELFRKIERICDSLEAKRFQQDNLLQMDLQQMNPGMAMSPSSTLPSGVNLNACGYGSRMLRVVALMLEKAVIWPGMLPTLSSCFRCTTCTDHAVPLVTHVMAKALETQAAHMDQRAEASRTK
jgi:hypothetical protein